MSVTFPSLFGCDVALPSLTSCKGREEMKGAKGEAGCKTEVRRRTGSQREKKKENWELEERGKKEIWDLDEKKKRGGGGSEEVGVVGKRTDRDELEERRKGKKT